MTDETAAGNGQAQNNAPNAPIQVLAQYVKDLSFENPNAPQSLLPGQPQPQVSVNVDTQARPLNQEAGLYECLLTLRAEAKAEEQTVFLVEVTYGGVFAIQGVAPEHHRPLMLIEAPRLLFPFARAVVAECTRDGGYPPLMVNPIDFAELFRQQLGAQQTANA
ncbi:MAG TPA: protein-export chaperone SecB [Alphaproteobacteria bacterium]|nr:protein-export chaperone SecB [Alphaproteobacteria bacterium]